MISVDCDASLVAQGLAHRGGEDRVGRYSYAKDVQDQTTRMGATSSEYYLRLIEVITIPEVSSTILLIRVVGHVVGPEDGEGLGERTVRSAAHYRSHANVTLVERALKVMEDDVDWNYSFDYVGRGCRDAQFLEHPKLSTLEETGLSDVYSKTIVPVVPV
jgi:hypothetical protein